jgi:hypothetical protein
MGFVSKKTQVCFSEIQKDEGRAHTVRRIDKLYELIQARSQVLSIDRMNS